MPAITGIEFRQFSAEHHNTKRNWLVVILKTDEPGLIGLGDASSLSHEEEVKMIAATFVDKFLLGKDPVDTEAHWSAIYHNARMRGGRLETTALSGIDIALWDLKGKILKRPVYQLLGGAQREQIPVYANGWYSNPGTPEENAAEAEKVVAKGYTALKFDPFGRFSHYQISASELQLACDRMAAVREVVGPESDILLEAHGRFNVAAAVQIGLRMEEFRPYFYEEPVAPENISELAQVRRRVNIPIATGERLYTKFPFAQIVAAEAADVLQPDIANAGGITELKKIAIIAEAAHVTIAPHNVCSPVGAIAEMHLATTIVNFEIQEYHAEFYSDQYFTVFDGFPRQKNGHVTLSDAPGLGLEINEAEIAAHPPLTRPADLKMHKCWI
jgi:galactonate dehydratase